MDEDPLGLCWACQNALTVESAVWIDDHNSIQCCKTCWNNVPVGQRLEIGLKFHDRSVEGFGIQETLQLIRDVLTSQGLLSRVLDEEHRRN